MIRPWFRRIPTEPTATQAHQHGTTAPHPRERLTPGTNAPATRDGGDGAGRRGPRPGRIAPAPRPAHTAALCLFHPLSRQNPTILARRRRGATVAICGLNAVVYAAAWHLITIRAGDVFDPAMLAGLDYATAAMLLAGLVAVCAGTTVRCAPPAVAGALAYVLSGMLLTVTCWLLVPLLHNHRGALSARTAEAVDRLADVLPYAPAVFLVGGLVAVATAVRHLGRP